ncbi:PAS domain S-box protein [Algoriphagus sp. AK58]|uniref:PAS domain S-box protein n=1 Tax=Algoriphagus sp. AK58 TaxID=1406877 RepID=UPI0016507D91|nr:PAS domain S-box protein [Algoriphagus sp. AK58]MBC6368500.1 hypothetical protein [Algoriphagus sp. AK58]
MEKKENKPFVFVLVSRDWTLDYVSPEDLYAMQEGLGWDVQLGVYLPQLIQDNQREYFIEQLKAGFSGKCFSFEILFPCKKTHQKSCEVVVTPAHYADGQVSKVGLAIRCRDEFHEELAKINEDGLLSIVFNSVSLGICITDHHGNFVEANREYCRIYGYEREELIGKSFLMVVDPSYHAFVQKVHDDFFTKGEEPPGEFEVLTINGSRITISVFSDKLVTPDGEKYKVTTVQDITELKALEDQVASVSQNIPGIVFRYLLKPDGTDQILFVSEGAKIFCGVNPQEILKDMRFIWDKIHPDFVENLRESILRSAQTLKHWESEWKYLHPDGTVRWHRARGNPRKQSDGSVVWDSIILDVTHEKEAELAVQETEVRFEKLISDGVEMIAILDSEGHYTYNSKSYQTILGYSPEELKGFQAFSLIHPDDVPTLYSDFQQVFAQKKVYSQPYRIRSKDGKYIWLKSIGTNLLDDPQIQGIVVNSTDVTELIQVKMDLESSEKQYKYLFENNPGSMMIWDLATGQILDVNDRTCRLYGYTREELLGMTVYDVRPKEEVPKFKEMSEKQSWVNYEGPRLYSGISRHIHKSGELLDVQINAQMIDYKGKRVSLVLLQDVTQKLKEEVRLKLLESVVTHANDAVIITEAEPFSMPGPRIVYVNEAFTRMTGYSAEEVIGKTPRILQGPKTNKEDLEVLREAMRNWESSEVTTINYRKNGEEFWTNFSISPVSDAKGWFTHWISIQRDVTKQKVEEQKRELASRIMQIFGEEERFNFALDRGLEQLVRFKDLDVGEVWLLNSEKSKLKLNSRFAHSEAGLKFISLVDRSIIFKKGEGLAGKIWKNNQPMVIDESVELQEFPRKDALIESGLTCAFGFPIHNNQEVIGVALFATKRKNGFVQSALDSFGTINEVLGSEIHRKKVEEELSQIFNTAQDIICISGFDGFFKKVNKGAVYNLGYSEEELLSKRYDHFLHPDDKAGSEVEMKNLINGQNVFHFVNRFISKEGDVVWLDWNCTAVPEEELIYCVAKNITEEKGLQNLLESANKMAKIGFWDVDVIRGTQYWSPITKEIHEVPSDFDPSVEQGILFYDPDSIPVISENFYRCQETGEPYDLELPIITAKGKPIWIRTQGQAEFRDGVCVRVYGTIQDITDRRAAEELIRQSNERFENVAKATRDAIWDHDIRSHKLYWGDGFRTLFGYEPNTYSQHFEAWVSKIHPEDKERVTGNLVSALENSSVLTIENEYRFLKADGTYAYVSDRGIIIRDGQGKAVRLVGAMSDVTERKKFESSLKSLNERLETRALELARSNAELEQFAYVASHDLQEPLRMVTSFLSQLEIKYQDKLDERANKYIHFAVDGAKRMRQIILDLLEFSRVGRMNEEVTQISIHSILKEVCTLQSSLIESKKAKIKWNEMPVITGSKTPLIQIFQNLISNAVKYSKEGVAPEVKISFKELPEFWQFEIQDNGIGIDAESIDKIFVIFQRLHTKDQYAGTGIGLAIVKKTIENLGGKIWVESSPGVGSTFRFTLKK